MKREKDNIQDNITHSAQLLFSPTKDDSVCARQLHAAWGPSRDPTLSQSQSLKPLTSTMMSEQQAQNISFHQRPNNRNGLAFKTIT